MDREHHDKTSATRVPVPVMYGPKHWAGKPVGNTPEQIEQWKKQRAMYARQPQKDKA